MNQTEVDVLVIGGGPAGICAAVQAAKSGAHTTLVESGSALGGATTISGVAFPGLFHAWGRQIIAGIGWNLVKEAARLGNFPLPDFTRETGRHWEQQVKINPFAFACLADEACKLSGVSLAFHQQIFSVQRKDHWVCQFVGKGGVQTRVAAKVLVDTTGDGDITRLAGYPCEKSQVLQPATLMLSFTGLMADDSKEQVVDESYRRALAEGRLQKGDFAQSKGGFMGFLKGRGENQVHLLGVDASTPQGKSDAETKGRSAALRLLRFLRTLPGCENATLASMSYTTGIRETYRIIGEKTITLHDYESGRPWPDSICHSFYPIDLHDDNGVVPKPLERGVVPQIPLGALVPRGSHMFLAAGRLVSSDRLAHSALRVQASCMAMGQAAGAAAALSSVAGIQPMALNLGRLKQELTHHGALVP